MPLAEFRALCYDYAMKQVENQKNGFLSLGCVGDYDDPYITLKKEFEASQILHLRQDGDGRSHLQGAQAGLLVAVL